MNTGVVLGIILILTGAFLAPAEEMRFHQEEKKEVPKDELDKVSKKSNRKVGFYLLIYFLGIYLYVVSKL